MPRRARNLALARLAVALAVALAAAACSRPGSSVAGPCSAHPAAEGGCQLTVGLGYIPSVQFAPFYLADQAGYYREAGLSVTFQNKIDPDLVALVGQGAIDIGVADGTSVIPAVSQGIPIRYVATIYGTYPSIVFAKQSSGIATAGDLRGKKLGIPGKYGSSWIMLQALLDSVHLTPDDLTVVEYPDFGQGVAVQQGAVDAATGFANNEPVQLQLTGARAVVLHVDDVIALPGPGLIASTSMLDANNNAVAGFVSATLRAMNEIAADPSKGLDAAIKAVPELGSQRDTQLAILNATIATWAPPGGDRTKFGTIDRDGWQASIDYLSKLGLVPNPVTVDGLVRDVGLLPVD
jgi:putative riboflavin transport system substrate-binding protein